MAATSGSGIPRACARPTVCTWWLRRLRTPASAAAAGARQLPSRRTWTAAWIRPAVHQRSAAPGYGRARTATDAAPAVGRRASAGWSPRTPVRSPRPSHGASAWWADEHACRPWTTHVARDAAAGTTGVGWRLPTPWHGAAPVLRPRPGASPGAAAATSAARTWTTRTWTARTWATRTWAADAGTNGVWTAHVDAHTCPCSGPGTCPGTSAGTSTRARTRPCERRAST